MDHDNPTTTRSRIDGGKLFLGLAILMFGLVAWIDQVGWLDLHLSWRLWPLILILIGLARFVDNPRRCGGLVMVLLGGLFFLEEQGIPAFRHGWPWLLVLGGLVIVWRALTLPERRYHA